MHYAVETLDTEGVKRMWRVHRFVSLKAAVAFRDRETARLRIGLDVVRVNADLSCDYMGREGEWHRWFRVDDYTDGGQARLTGSDTQA